MQFLRRHRRKLLSGLILVVLYPAGYAAARASHLIIRAETRWRYGSPMVGGGTDSYLVPGYYDQTEQHPHRNLGGRVAVQAFWPLCKLEAHLRSSEWQFHGCD